MKVLITGGAGFIGSSLARELVQSGATVTVVDCLSPQIHGDNPETSQLFLSLPPSVKVIRSDVRSREIMSEALKGQDVVVHLAAETGTGQSMYEIDRYVDVNIRGTSILLDILEKERPGVKRVVVASSRAIYGEGRYQGKSGTVYPVARTAADMEKGIFDCRCPDTGEIVTSISTDETSKIHPTSIYGITKQVQEQLVLTACESMGIGAVSLRYQNVYGPGQSLKNPYTGILSIFSTLLLQGRDVNIFEDGEESRDFVYIDDVVSATVKAINSDVTGECYNVGSGVRTTVMTVAKTLKELYGAPGDIKVSGNYRVGDIRHNTADLSKVSKDLAFHPSVTFVEGVTKFAEWVKSQHLEVSTYDKSIQEMRDRGMFK
ncbi:epimerase [Parazoarcus communis]|uniref:Epimerase n=1 Tax=Parazoarcus communis TaxID=41977 RepID=A0A2U8H719_9RHOO|nr:NAD-dependent epimerase/dehydratase family protein [Parazoarcus communis]AWI81672.1 epimerase [Parazoarcus communis]